MEAPPFRPSPLLPGLCPVWLGSFHVPRLLLTSHWPPAPSLSTPARALQVRGHQYSVFESVYLRPFPRAAPWIARIEEIRPRIGANNKVQAWIAVRRFYRRSELEPSTTHGYPE